MRIEPVKLILSTSGWRAMRLAGGVAVAGEDVQDALREAGLAARARASLSAVSGVSSEGFSTTVQPAASAGPSFQHMSEVG